MHCSVEGTSRVPSAHPVGPKARVFTPVPVTADSTDDRSTATVKKKVRGVALYWLNVSGACFCSSRVTAFTTVVTTISKCHSVLGLGFENLVFNFFL